MQEHYFPCNGYVCLDAYEYDRIGNMYFIVAVKNISSDYRSSFQVRRLNKIGSLEIIGNKLGYSTKIEAKRELLKAISRS